MSRRHVLACLKAHPCKPWLVVERDANEDEASPFLISARTPSQAARLWRERTGYTLDDFSIEEIDIRPAEWEWPGIPEPACPKQPGIWDLQGKTEDGEELWRGYGLRLDSDIRCDGCDDLTAEERIREVTGPNGGLSLCPVCLDEYGRSGAEVLL